MGKAQRHWDMVLGLLVKTGMTVRSMEMFYKEVVYEVLLYRSEIWVITDFMMKVLELFYHLTVIKIAKGRYKGCN